MRAFFRHFIHSLRYIATRPMAWLVVPVAACWSGFLETAFVVGWLRVGHHGIGLALADAALLSLPLVWCAFVAAILPCSARAPASMGGKWAMPALPISPRVRVLAEVTAALALLFVVRSPLVIWSTMRCLRYVAHWWQSLSFAVGELRVASSWDLLLGFPLLAAWLGSGRTGSYYHARLFGAHVVVFVGFAAMLSTGQVQMASTGQLRTTLLPLMALLSVAVVYSIGREPSWDLASLRRLSSGALHRTPLGPERRFRADVLRRSAPLLGIALLPGLIAAPLAIAHGVVEPPGGQESPWMLVTGLAVMSMFLVTWLAVAIATLLPLRLPLFTNTQELFVGRYCASWAALPVRPEAVRRLVHTQAFVAPLLGCAGFVVGKGLVWACIGRAHELGTLAWLPDGRTVLGWSFAAACWASLALCVAVGDRVRAILAAIGVGLSLYWLSDENRRLALALFVGVAGLLAALPLVHLRRLRRLA